MYSWHVSTSNVIPYKEIKVQSSFKDVNSCFTAPPAATWWCNSISNQVCLSFTSFQFGAQTAHDDVNRTITFIKNMKCVKRGF